MENSSIYFTLLSLNSTRVSADKPRVNPQTITLFQTESSARSLTVPAAPSNLLSASQGFPTTSPQNLLNQVTWPAVLNFNDFDPVSKS